MKTRLGALAAVLLFLAPAGAEPLRSPDVYLVLSSGSGSVAMRWKRCTKPDIAPEDRMVACRQLIKDNATNVIFAYIALGDLYMDADDTASAIQLYTDGVHHYGGRIPLMLRAEVYAETGDYDDAMADVQAMFGQRGTEIEVLHHRCWIRALAGKELEAGLADCDAVLKDQPDNAGALDSRGLVLLKLGRTDDALASYSAAIKFSPTLASAWYMRGLIERQTGDTASGDADIAQAVALFPHIAEIYAHGGEKPK